MIEAAPDSADYAPDLRRIALDFDPLEGVDLPVWDRKPCPTPLIPEFVDMPAGQHLYAVMDGARRGAVLGTNDLDCLDEDLGAVPLFDTGGAEDVQGPWLIDLGREGVARDRFLADFFAQFAGTRQGIFLRSAADAGELRAHLRGLLKVARGDAEEPRDFLRYWDPMVAAVLMDQAVLRPKRMERLCFSRSGAAVDWYVEEGTARFLHYHVGGDGPAMKARGPVHLDAEDEAAFQGLAYVALGGALAKWLFDAYPIGAPDAPRMDRIGRHLVAQGQRFGFGLKDEFSYLGHMSVHLGAWFFETGLFAPVMAVLADDAKARHKPLRGAFSQAWAGSYLPVVAAAKAEMLADPLLADGPFLDHERVGDLFKRHLPGPAHGDLRPLWRKAMAHARACDMPDELHPAAGLLTIFAGYRFYEDPLVCAGVLPDDPAAWQDVFSFVWNELKGEPHG